MQWPGETLASEARVEGVRDAERRGIHDDERVDRWPLLVVRVDPPKILLDEGPTGQRSGPHRRMHVGDRRFFDAKRARRRRHLSGRGARAGRQKHERKRLSHRVDVRGISESRGPGVTFAAAASKTKGERM